MIREYESVKQFGQNAPDLYAAFKEYAENDMALRGVPGAKKSAVSVKEMVVLFVIFFFIITINLEFV